MDRFEQIRLLEALLFAAQEPIREKQLAERMPSDADLNGLLQELQSMYANRGVQLRRIEISKNENAWAFRTADDLSSYMSINREVEKKLSRAAIETLSIIAYHQPVTRAEIEDIRGVALSKGTMDILLEASWIKPKGRRQTPGRPVTWGTTGNFLDHFGLETVRDLPGMEELRASGLLESRPGLGTIAMQQSEAAFDGSEEDEEDFEGLQDELFDLEDDYEAVELEEDIAIED
ncbi:SMC-Scp complex subunit ScpB [Curvivirga aplysinae]|uniref:SMC-Scp complex subunit ScpB n=1 Tax=Curvivirga aplysinae TaxID=2529852 RepID=UPI0012BBAFE9|nr:SMC-Scp complex subunit ScpB [Curvivirga aplysinae]MTI10701.1 SMC-Scp complex subunit ScpB [Curvivirga aplysinae]